MKTLFIALAVVFSNLAGGGWVMTDEESGKVVGFSESGEVDCADVPVALREMMGGKEFRSEFRETTDAKTKIQKIMAAGNVVVEPMIWVKWGQGTYYNSMCPEDSKGQGGHAQVGCGALVMGEIMRYWHYPVNGKGSYSYEANFSAYGYGDYGTQSADFENTYYDYDNMPQKLTAASTEAQKEAVATLLYHCGVAVNMAYGAKASTAQSWMMVFALSRYFRFPSTVEYIEKANYTTTEWHEILQGELDERAPFFYGASGSYGGHVFICDGYRDDNYYHLVWGWNGQYDGWFKIGDFTPGPYDFNQHHAAIIGIRGDHVPEAVEETTADEEVLICQNPVKDVLMLNGEHKGAIYDMAGRLMMSFEGENVNVSSLANGAYYLRTENGKGGLFLIEN